MNFTYLADRPEAVTKIATWYFEQWGHRMAESSDEETSLRLQKYLNRDEIPLMVLAVDGDDILGVAQLKYHEMEMYPEKEHWLGGVFVAPAHRGKGVAALLVNKVIELARSFGVETLHLQTEQLDGGLYARLGWKSKEIVKYKDLDVLVMEKKLIQSEASPVR